jgi:N-methylhydantoinase A
VENKMDQYRVSVDIGGTFTDVITTDTESGQVTVGKTSTTPHDLTEGILNGLDSVVPSFDEISFLVHGTTQGLNAFLQRRGERVMLLATEGSGDVYHIARGNRDSLYDIHYRKPVPLVPKRDIFEIPGRLNYRGEERTPLDVAVLKKVAKKAKEENFGAIAISFLFSYVNPEHELSAAQILADELGDDFPIRLSHQVAREWREYERTSSTVLDAYIAPGVRRYLSHLKKNLNERQVSAALHVMQSNGGIMTDEVASRQCLQTLLSGPVGGTVGGASLAQEMGMQNLICVDMGGTSFDVSLIVEGEPDIDVEASLEGLPILAAVTKIHTIGAGGGSVAYIEGGGLRVGPRSAGAQPGPACYGRGGLEPTVTDSDLVLGRVDPSWFAGGTVDLDLGMAEMAVKGVADQLGLSVRELAEGISSIIDSKMAQAIRTITVEKGLEPRDYTVLAYGGAGPVHAAFVADELGISTVIVPRYPGAFSAWGMLQTDLRQDLSDALFARLDNFEPEALIERYEAMAKSGRDGVSEQGTGAGAIAVRRGIDLRYEGQEYTLTIPIPDELEADDPKFAELMGELFHEAYRRRFGHSNEGAPIEIVTLRSTAVGTIERRPLVREEIHPKQAIGIAHSMVFNGQEIEAVSVQRGALNPGTWLVGPALVLEETATTVVPPGWRLDVDGLGCLRLTRQNGSE